VKGLKYVHSGNRLGVSRKSNLTWPPNQENVENTNLKKKVRTNTCSNNFSFNKFNDLGYLKRKFLGS
jgi:hypothetical protein